MFGVTFIIEIYLEKLGQYVYVGERKKERKKENNNTKKNWFNDDNDLVAVIFAKREGNGISVSDASIPRLDPARINPSEWDPVGSDGPRMELMIRRG